jgi:two-component system, OmpR family, sensor histidine kinase CiaH
VIENSFIELDSQDTEFLFSLQNHENTSTEFQGHAYLVSRIDQGDRVVFLFHDLAPIQDFHRILLIIALLGSLIALIIIYILARYLARITIEPIREQSRELEAYSHNVAHELRTPLSVMRSNLELLRLKPEERFIRSTDEEITGMERIIESLLFLAKPDTGSTETEIDITKKTTDIIAKYTPENPIKYKIEKKHIYKCGSEELYSRILCNVIENAIKYKSE